MKKLLHERLRGWEEQSRNTDHFPFTLATEETYKDFGFCGTTTEAKERERNLCKLMADEIESYYIPRPRFEDGEPVQFGDEVEGCNGRVETIIIFDDGSGVIYGRNDYEMPEEYGGAEFDEDGLQRPSPKVLDADGVEIKEGETIWHIQSGEKFMVHTVQSDGCVFSVNDIYLEPKAMTHKEPDSLQKLRDDLIELIGCLDINETSVELERFAYRLYALIQRESQ